MSPSAAVTPLAEVRPVVRQGLHELSRDECLTRLAANGFGRIVIASRTQLPMIRPVNYVFDGPSQSVVFQTVPGSKLNAVVRSTRACFEIDGIDAGLRQGWSVIIVGHTEAVTQPAEVRRLDALGPLPWATGEHPHWVRIRARTVSGRRIGPT